MIDFIALILEVLAYLNLGFLGQGAQVTVDTVVQ